MANSDKRIVYTEDSGNLCIVSPADNCPLTVEEIQAIVNSLKERNIGVLITDHNVRETLSITDRSYLLFNGQILKSGTSEFLANDKEAKRLYLGEKFRLD